MTRQLFASRLSPVAWFTIFVSSAVGTVVLGAAIIAALAYL